MVYKFCLILIYTIHLDEFQRMCNLSRANKIQHCNKYNYWQIMNKNSKKVDYIIHTFYLKRFYNIEQGSQQNMNFQGDKCQGRVLKGSLGKNFYLRSVYLDILSKKNCKLICMYYFQQGLKNNLYCKHSIRYLMVHSIQNTVNGKENKNDLLNY